MTEIIKATEVLAEPSSVFEQIDSLIQKLLAAETKLDHGYAKLGLLLTEVSEQELWRGTFKSFNDYIESLCEKYHKGRTMLFTYFTAVREMRPYLSPEQMNKMGISKLNELKSTTRKLGFPPANEVIETALDPEKTVSDVRKSVAQNHNLTPQEQNGTWLDLGGFFVTPEERTVITESFQAAWRTDPVVSPTVKETIRIKEAILRLAMEYLSVHSGAEELI